MTDTCDTLMQLLIIKLNELTGLSWRRNFDFDTEETWVEANGFLYGVRSMLLDADVDKYARGIIEHMKVHTDKYDPRQAHKSDSQQATPDDLWTGA